ncbi:transcriptional regulator, AsnC family [Chloroherpeton thalassium ATCC 35110]|uniref:Transcriptional regulator, AsnC family n=1 Tax=Chloroherpeton thalassium (strain ATCC 35110 / GB-78) TaxID=517418 RepID=B3QSC4_CHLT3|nr:Lrp/AsnC family transcriptional regulator [Chloroherpeton thalassium]ACF12515.1 transcriptional regulator, AsnC family [Chloroherpeton thalassium ATCC 35110]
MTWHIDKIDLKLLDLLNEQGRIRRNELAEAVGLSIPSVSERLEKLEKRGVITGYTVLIDEKKLGFDITSYIRVRMESSKHYPALSKHVQKEDEILECYTVTGEGSHLLKVKTQNTSSLEKLLARIQSWPGVIGTETSFVLSTLKHSFNVPAEKAFKDIEKIRFEESTTTKRL